MTRKDFDCLKNKRAYAERQYHVVSAMLMAELRENGVFSDGYGRITEVHHIWMRSHCPLWYIFQPENLYPISAELHQVIHCKAPGDMTPTEREYYDYFQQRIEQLKKENDAYITETTKG
jgi:hypothetical protein